MDEWNQTGSGAWCLEIDGRSLTLPVSFSLDHKADDVVGFVDDGPGLPSCRIVFKQRSARSFLDSTEELKHLRTFRVSGVPVDEFAPVTKSGRAKPGIRMYLVELASTATIMIVDEDDRRAQRLAEQWSRNRAEPE